MDLISENFKREEFDCHDGTAVPPSLRSNLTELCLNLEVIRNHLGKPIIITSGYRTVSWNKSQGGATSSQHLLCKAADIKVKNMNSATLAGAIAFLISSGRIKEGGLGIYDGWVHYDIRGTKARWDFRKKK